MNSERLPEYIQFLMNADVYPHPVDKVQLIQTHISFVILAGPYVYKWKKPVDLGFLNFSTLARRRYFCTQELLLNRRLCSDVYIDMVVLTVKGTTFCLGGNGKKIEYGVKMIRLPEDRMMCRIIDNGSLEEQDLDKVVEKLVPFYERSDRSSRVTKFGSVREVGRSVLENFIQTEPFVGQDCLKIERFEKIRNFATRFLGKSDLFKRRVIDGRVRDCHGDLHSANICFTKEVTIFDCIEFSRRLRCTDVAADVAFLAMDLDVHGLHNLSDYFIERFVEEARDPYLRTMLDFYKCYRAYVRGKIHLLTAIDPAVDAFTSIRSKEQAGRYFALAESYAMMSPWN